MSKIYLFEVAHKKVDKRVKDRLLIKVGNDAAFDDYDYFDGDGDNIHDKNPYYCELTAIYWIWKNFNCDKEDYIGIEHYRRFFYDHNFIQSKLLDNEKINEIFKHHDYIFPMKYIGKKNNLDHYNDDHPFNDLSMVRSIIEKDYNNYLAQYDKVMSEKSTYLYNMVIIKKKDFDNYCSWLFNILFSLENQIDYKNRDTYQRRTFGFLSERLLTVYFYNAKKVYLARVYDKETKVNFIKRFVHEILLRNYHERKLRKKLELK